MLSVSTMTAQRQERYGPAPRNSLYRALAGLSLVGLGCWRWISSAARAATTERVVVNRYSGLAIEGYDPVAYFTDARAVRGLPDFEAAEAGAVWRFRNESNRASFVAHPEIYGPQFGGYDPIDLARGVTVCRQSPVLGGGGAAALSVRPRGKPRCLRRRSGAVSLTGGRGALAAGRGSVFAAGNARLQPS